MYHHHFQQLLSYFMTTRLGGGGGGGVAKGKPVQLCKPTSEKPAALGRHMEAVEVVVSGVGIVVKSCRH